MLKDVDKIQFDYKPSGFSVLDNGHTFDTVTVTTANDVTFVTRALDADGASVLLREFGEEDDRVIHYLGAGRQLAILNVNNDIGEFMEYSATGFFPVDITNDAYKLGVNYLIYALTH